MMRHNCLKIIVGTIVLAACCSYFVVSIDAMLWRMRFQVGASDIADIAYQYTSYRCENGVWPDRKDVYSTGFSIVAVARDGDSRVDTFIADVNGPWLLVKLRSNGHLSIQVAWEKP